MMLSRSIRTKTVFSKWCVGVVITALFCSVVPVAGAADMQPAVGHAFAAMNRVSEQLAGVTPEEVDAALADTWLPEQFRTVFAQALDAARLDAAPQEQAAAFVQASGLDCSELLYYLGVAIAVDLVIDNFILNIPYIELISNVLAAATLLCYLGII